MAANVGAETALPLRGAVESWRGLSSTVPVKVILFACALGSLSTDHFTEGFWGSRTDAEMGDVARVGLADAAVENAPVSRWDDVEPGNSGQVVSLDMPKGPLKGQKRAPCRPKWEVEVSKACWVQVGTVSPPCGSEGYEWKGFCYVPVIAPERPNTSDGQ
ncbi:Protein kinase [Stigmatella aurantiaca DW4/3-1]|uniref:Protein kinase n=1 Tax=Stigmatella aurantiaca (strain DW4/3-1) TaxID=378806 RepID=E3FI67_STIAD|nr:Protein kinase [Stigmatella aurantiaca DW4/3-1]